jgi:RNA polymerase sigma-70 factor (ECF subfamily)
VHERAAGPVDPSRASDNELIEAARRSDSRQAEKYLDELYRRYYRKVAHWCLKICGDRQEAADVAQEVFLRVHSRLDTFRGESRFSTWLYTVMRRVVINRGIAARRHEEYAVQAQAAPEPVDPIPNAQTVVETSRELQRLREAMEQQLDPLEAKVLYLHYVTGLTLPAITRLLSLENKSGAKAFILGGKRKLRQKLMIGNRKARPTGGGRR